MYHNQRAELESQDENRTLGNRCGLDEMAGSSRLQGLIHV
jgi:hypothetical protein